MMQTTATKHDHRRRGTCSVTNCTNQVYARQLCCRHGAKKQCIVTGCSLRARLNDVCFKHGAQKKQCIEQGCAQPAQARQRCVKHGGGRHCKVNGCFAHSRVGGFCQRHRLPGSLLETMDMSWDESKAHNDRSYSVASNSDVCAAADTSAVVLDPWVLCLVDPIRLNQHACCWSNLSEEDSAMMQDIFGLLAN
ncbi:hypothetical protein DYB37_012578 [Aphanomyces astaci]|uniref:Uncharacterized protein n=1 Tax=Aphanomyces astaci TaxID=112090 RepID=A0A3R7BL27_APHAT|nr:hypothetical protein DYB37_012578 [Aphanomyces astaci]